MALLDLMKLYLVDVDFESILSSGAVGKQIESQPDRTLPKHCRENMQRWAVLIITASLICKKTWLGGQCIETPIPKMRMFRRELAAKMKVIFF